MKWTISRKLMIGYLGMALLMVLASTYAINHLQNLNSLARTIINQDFTVLETAKQMMDTLRALENAEKKYLILKDPSIEEMFWTSNKEITAQLDILSHSPFREVATLASHITTYRKAYEAVFQKEIALATQSRNEEALQLSSTEGRKLIDNMAALIRTLQKRAEKNIDGGMNEINTSSIQAHNLTVILTTVSLLVGLILAFLITLNISRPLKQLEKATGLVAEGQFDTKLSIQRNDEIGHLAQSFDRMTQRLKILEAMQLDASPLTRLPGNLAIEQHIRQRLTTGQSFSLCHIDLDNFKPFADAYGYAWGSEVIKETSAILDDVKKAENKEDIFIGHIGGDDFILIAEPMGAKRMCQRIVTQFEERIKAFYNEEDRQRGFIVAKDRKGQMQNFPLITITVSMVTGDGSTYKSPLDMAKMAAEVKEYGKTLPGSNFVTREEMAGHDA